MKDVRTNCDICGKPLGGGGADVVSYLRSSVDSFHHFQHMECRDEKIAADEREACAKIALTRALESPHSGRANEAHQIAELIRNRTQG